MGLELLLSVESFCRMKSDQRGAGLGRAEGGPPSPSKPESTTRPHSAQSFSLALGLGSCSLYMHHVGSLVSK